MEFDERPDVKKKIRIGNAGGYWGDDPDVLYRQLKSGPLDYITMDFLAEITMSIMARARSQDDSRGYALDFVSAAMKPNLAKIAERGIRVISNAGGVNPLACADALRTLIAEQGLNLQVAVAYGGRWDIVQAAKMLAEQVESGEVNTGEIDEALLTQSAGDADGDQYFASGAIAGAIYFGDASGSTRRDAGHAPGSDQCDGSD